MDYRRKVRFMKKNKFWLVFGLLFIIVGLTTTYLFLNNKKQATADDLGQEYLGIYNDLFLEFKMHRK